VFQRYIRIRPLAPSGGCRGPLINHSVRQTSNVSTHRHEVSIVEPAPILRVRDDSVVLASTASEIILLEITRNLVEAIPDSQSVIRLVKENKEPDLYIKSWNILVV
jgi:hypothetical protein